MGRHMNRMVVVGHRRMVVVSGDRGCSDVGVQVSSGACTRPVGRGWREDGSSGGGRSDPAGAPDDGREVQFGSR